MAKFNLNDRVYVKEELCKGTVIGVDSLSRPLPVYKVLIDESNKVKLYYGAMLRCLVSSDDALRYGEILTDDNMCCVNYYPKKEDSIRIRTIRYDSVIYYHKMVNGEVVEFKELTF